MSGLKSKERKWNRWHLFFSKTEYVVHEAKCSETYNWPSNSTIEGNNVVHHHCHSYNGWPLSFQLPVSLPVNSAAKSPTSWCFPDTCQSKLHSLRFQSARTGTWFVRSFQLPSPPKFLAIIIISQKNRIITIINKSTIYFIKKRTISPSEKFHVPFSLISLLQCVTVIESRSSNGACKAKP